MALGVQDVLVGDWTSPGRITGCTVILPPSGTVGAIAVRGGSPGTREAMALGPHGRIEACHGIVLAGSSAYGLDAAHGVMLWLEERGVGHVVGPGVVPIVGAAILLDAGVMTPGERADAAAGRLACEQAVEGDPAEGGVGVGTGCSVAKVAGLEYAWRGGQGIAVRRAAGVTVGALVANNAVGEVVADDGAWIARARIADDAPRFPTNGERRPVGPHATGEASAGNTAIGCIVTDARLTKQEAHRVADLGHSGLSRSLRPAHTQFDGDALFCLATGRVDAGVDLVASLAADAVAEAARRGPMAAVGLHGVPGLADDQNRR